MRLEYMQPSLCVVCIVSASAIEDTDCQTVLHASVDLRDHFGM